MIPVITIDGPSGTGKGTVSGVLCEKLAFNFLDSGALYRLLGLAAKKHTVQLDEHARLAEMAGMLDIRFQPGKEGASGEIYLEGHRVTEEIRTEACGTLASKIAVIPQVRQALVARQHEFRKPPGLVADGRDMGTVIFPDANLKIFLTASAEVRAERRYNQLKLKGIDVKLDAVLDEIRARDARDSGRAVAPLRPADDAVIIDTSTLPVDAVVNRIMGEWVKCGA